MLEIKITYRIMEYLQLNKEPMLNLSSQLHPAHLFGQKKLTFFWIVAENVDEEEVYCYGFMFNSS